MDKEAIFSLIDKCRTRYNSPIIEANGYYRVAPKIINQVNCYMNSRFVEPAPKGQQDKRVFYGVTKQAVDTYHKNIDLDTKDIQFKAKDSKYRLNVYFCNRKLQDFNDKYNAGYFLNRLGREWVTYGNVIIRENEDEMPEIMDLNNFLWDVHAIPDTTTFNLQGDYAIAIRQLTPDKIEEHTEWENVDKVMGEYYKAVSKIDIPTIKILDCQLLAPHSMFDGKKGYGYYHVVVAYDGNIDSKEILYYKRIDKLGYKSFSGLNNGRANFKIGIPEMIFEDQMQVNTAMTKYAMALEIAGLNIFQTQYPTTMKNILTGAKNGDIYNMSLSKIDTGIINPTQFINFKELFEDVIRRKTNSFEILTGENLPSNQTLGGAVLQTQAGGKLFEIERENFGAFIDEIYKDWVLPSFEKNIKQEEVLEILDQKDLQEIWEVSANINVANKVLENVFKNDTKPTAEDITQMKEVEMSKMKKRNQWKVTKDYLTDYPKKLYIDTSGEKHNIQQRISVMSQILLNSNILGVLSNPMTAKAGEELLELVGFDKNLLDLSANNMVGVGQQQTQQSTPQSAIQNIANQFTQEGEVNK